MTGPLLPLTPQKSEEKKIDKVVFPLSFFQHVIRDLVRTFKWEWRTEVGGDCLNAFNTHPVLSKAAPTQYGCRSTSAWLPALSPRRCKYWKHEGGLMATTHNITLRHRDTNDRRR